VTAGSVIQTVCALIVLAEALNKVERSDVFGGRRGFVDCAAGAAWLLVPWKWQRSHIVTVLKACGWSALSVGAAASMVTPATLAHLAVLGGFALLIVRSRVKEG
jgi:hypothetical protein